MGSAASLALTFSI